MIVISDTTPIISLLKADQLGLLEKLYGNVLIPRAVYRELTENPRYTKEAAIIKKLDFLITMEVENIKSVNILRTVTGLDTMLENGIRLDKKICNIIMNHVGLENQN